MHELLELIKEGRRKLAVVQVLDFNLTSRGRTRSVQMDCGSFARYRLSDTWLSRYLV